METIQLGQFALLVSSVIAFIVLCLTGSHVSMRLYARLRRADSNVRSLWLMLSTLCAASTIWALHFLAVTLTRSGASPYTAGFDLVISQLGILVLVGLGFAIASHRSTMSLHVELGGALIGFGVAAVHLNSLRVSNVLDLGTSSVLSIIVGFTIVALFGAIATNRVARPVTRYCRYGGSAAFALAITLCFVLGNASNLGDIPKAALYENTLVSALTICAVAYAIILSGFATLAIDIRATQTVARQLQNLSLSDSVTGVRNRAGLQHDLTNRLNDRNTDNQMFLLFAVEFNELDAINDAHGYDAGDHVLKTQASRLANWLQDDGAVGRIDGPKLAVMTPCYYSGHEVAAYKEAIKDILCVPIEWEERSLIASGSLGAAEFPHNGDDATNLVRRAEIAAKRAVEDETISVAMYDESIDEKVRSNGALAMDLRHAIDGGQLEMYYQPQHSVCTRELIGFEALMRWTHPEQGMVAPFIFIPIAEQTGQIIALGDWALLTSCQEAASWKLPIKVAVNVATQQLMANDFAQKIEQVLSVTNLPPERLEIEITESGLISDHARALHTIEAVKALGVGIAMDDYGTGYSSLSTLRSFPFDKIKIDREFIKSVEHDRQSQAIVKATVALGISLEIPVLAEGVEYEQHMQFLSEVGCSDVQGYLFGRPMPAPDIHTLLDEYQFICRGSAPGSVLNIPNCGKDAAA